MRERISTCVVVANQERWIRLKSADRVAPKTTSSQKPAQNAARNSHRFPLIPASPVQPDPGAANRTIVAKGYMMLRTERNIAIFKALSDDTRLQILEMLIDGERCACKILEELEITQPALSYQMKILTSCGLVQVQKVGTWAHYSLDTEVINDLADEIRDTLCSKV